MHPTLSGNIVDRYFDVMFLADNVSPCVRGVDIVAMRFPSLAYDVRASILGIVYYLLIPAVGSAC